LKLQRASKELESGIETLDTTFASTHPPSIDMFVTSLIENDKRYVLGENDTHIGHTYVPTA
jgi:hypothetical protein